MRSILLFADKSAAMPARLETALSLARMNDGHLSVLVDTPVARFMAMDAMGGSYLAADAIREALERDDAYAEELAEHLAREDVPFDVLRCEDEPADALVEAARLSDVIVLSRGCEFAGQVAVTSGTPVLLVPDDLRLGLPAERACVGWDGGEDLSRHGVKAELHELDRVGSIEETLAAGVARLQGDLLVMGAFGHSRLREFLFGGVTRYFLGNGVAPALLLAH